MLRNAPGLSLSHPHLELVCLFESSEIRGTQALYVVASHTLSISAVIFISIFAAVPLWLLSDQLTGAHLH